MGAISSRLRASFPSSSLGQGEHTHSSNARLQGFQSFRANPSKYARNPPQRAVLLLGVCRMIIYIAGPMTGHPQNNYPAFWYTADRLRAHGITVLCPADLPKMDSWQDYMRASLAMLLQATHIHFLQGWHESKGALVESFIANQLDVSIYTAPICCGDDCTTCQDYIEEREPEYNEAAACKNCDTVFIDEHGSIDFIECAESCCGDGYTPSLICCKCGSEMSGTEAKTKCYECHNNAQEVAS